MKRVFTSRDTAELGLLKNMPQKAGIRCVERNEQMAQTLPSALFQAELCIENESDYPTAAAILKEWQRSTNADRVVWLCSQCGEKLGSQFSKYWKCVTRREMPPLEAAPSNESHFPFFGRRVAVRP